MDGKDSPNAINELDDFYYRIGVEKKKNRSEKVMKLSFPGENVALSDPVSRSTR